MACADLTCRRCDAKTIRHHSMPLNEYLVKKIVLFYTTHS